jgi:hypothetical protein
MFAYRYFFIYFIFLMKEACPIVLGLLALDSKKVWANIILRSQLNK